MFDFENISLSCGMKDFADNSVLKFGNINTVNDGDVTDGVASFEFEKDEVANVFVEFDFDDWSRDNYVLVPAAVYSGNRFRSIKDLYPPFLHEEDGIGVDMDITITDVPRLNIGEGESKIHLYSGDMSTPAVCIFMPHHKKGFIVLFEHITKYGYTGIRLEENGKRDKATLKIEAPCIRKNMYTFNYMMGTSDDKPASFKQGDKIKLKFRVIYFDCDDVLGLFKKFAVHRKDLTYDCSIKHEVPFKKAYNLIEEKYNKSQFNDEYGYYMLEPNGQGTVHGDWQAGWCGGGLNSLAFAYDGNELSQKRADSTMDAIFGILKHKSGFTLPIFSGGKPLGDDYDNLDKYEVLLIRKDGDVLLYALRYILLKQGRGEDVPQVWLDGCKELADAFVRLWERYGQFGQFIDIEAEEIIIGNTAAGSIIPSGLALASKVLGNEKYLKVAMQSAEYYYINYVCKGILNGGPGEILQCPDSESASNMLESFMVLYEVTTDKKWLVMAEDTAYICASWCTTYNFKFPTGSEFGRLGINTLGSVWANVQNKHAAPGFCTLSGASLYRLYRATGNPLWLEMCKETAHNITQYLSRDDRLIHDWDDGTPLASGMMCERVNMSDWEGKDKIGGVFNGSCWCEISCLLTYAEIPGVVFLSDTGTSIVFDHVEVKTTGENGKWKLEIYNPTKFDTTVKIFTDRQADFDKPLGQCFADECKKVDIKANDTIEIFI